MELKISSNRKTVSFTSECTKTFSASTFFCFFLVEIAQNVVLFFMELTVLLKSLSPLDVFCHVGQQLHFWGKMSTKNLEFSLCIRILFSQKWRDVSIILFFVDFSPSFFYQDFPLYSMNQHMIQSRFYLLWEKCQTDANLSNGIGILLGFIGQKLKLALIFPPTKTF